APVALRRLQRLPVGMPGRHPAAPADPGRAPDGGGAKRYAAGQTAGAGGLEAAGALSSPAAGSGHIEPALRAEGTAAHSGPAAARVADSAGASLSPGPSQAT